MVRRWFAKPINVGSIPTLESKYAAVAQLEEVLVLETRGYGFDSHRQYQAPEAEVMDAHA